jgi:hypothetical protein
MKSSIDEGVVPPAPIGQEGGTPARELMPGAETPEGGAGEMGTPQDPVARVLEALHQERRALRSLLQDHRRLQEQNAELARQLMDLPWGDPVEPCACSLEASENARLTEMQAELERSDIRYRLLKSENTGFVDRCQKLMEENNNLSKLYIASHRLHATLKIHEVLQTISEIMLNLVGAEVHAIFFHDERARHLLPVLAMGFNGNQPEEVPLGEGAVGRSVLSEQNYCILEPPEAGTRSPDHPLVVIPMKFRDRLLGAIAIYRLLSHKPELTDVDHALFDLFATHAAMAIHSARLYSESEKKVEKMKEFLTLMQPPEHNDPRGEAP